MSKETQSILQKVYYSVSPLSSEYFRKVWEEQNNLSRKQFYNRLKNPTIDDVLLFCHVCKVDEKEILQPLKSKYKNVPPFSTNLQLTIEP